MADNGQGQHKVERGRVRRRHVFYVSGHDPAGARRYRELYRREGAKQARISGYEMEVTAHDAPPGRYQWRAETVVDGQRTEAVIEFLQWNDIVRDSLAKSLPGTYATMFRSVWIALRTGLLISYYRVRPAMLITVFYPYATLLLAPILGAVLGALAAVALAAVVPMPPFAWAATVLAGIVAGLAILRRIDRRYFVSYLALAYGWYIVRRGRMPPEIVAREDVFVDWIAQALASDADEVLLVGHSVGAHLAVILAARAIREGHDPQGKLALLNLGSVIPLISVMPDAGPFRTDLKTLAARPGFGWVEVSAPGDGMCFALADPVAISGVAPDPQHGPLILTAAFRETLDPQTMAAKEFTPYRAHFQYIHAFDRPRGYDYFLVTAGPLGLAERYRNTRSTRSRVTRVASFYTDTPAVP